MKMTEVAAALIWRDDQFMICQRQANEEILETICEVYL